MDLSDRTVSGKGFRVTFKTGTVKKAVSQAVMDGLNDAGARYTSAIKDNLSLSDHSLADLRKLGSPYAVQSPGAAVHDDDRLVHTQSGELLEGIGMKAAYRSGSSYVVHITSQAAYTDFLLNGTSRMRPRRFDEKAFEDAGGERIFDSLRARLSALNYRIG